MPCLTEQLWVIQLNLISNAKKALPIAKQKKSENTHVIQKRHLWR
jgi:hypothetical protein